MKKISALLMCVMLVFCTSCGNKEKNEEVPPQKVEENLVEEATGDINKKIAEDPMSVEQSDIDAAKASADKMAEDLKNQAGKVAQEDVEQYQNRQAAVAIMQQGLEALEKAKAEGNEEAIKSAQMQIQMAESLWDFVQGETE